MAFRVIKIDSRCKLETQLNYLVCRKDTDVKIPIDEIAMIIIESQQACFTQALITTLLKNNVRIMFCDEKHNPMGEISPYCPTQSSYMKVEEQISWNEDIKDLVWQFIVKLKIQNQSYLLKKYNYIEQYKLLLKYITEVEKGDTTNREGLAAKVYFSTLFGSNFERRDTRDIRNMYLDYGYSLLLACTNRSIASLGYLTQIGIHHIGKTNMFNLGCDFMEPFRPFIDEIVLSNNLTKENFKKELLNIMNMLVLCNENKTQFDNAVYDFVLSCSIALKNNMNTKPRIVNFIYE